MATFDTPSISVGNKSNEENIQALKVWTLDLVEQLNYLASNHEDRLSALESNSSNSSNSES